MKEDFILATLTMLTEMMGPDVEKAIEQMRDLGMRQLDLKGGIYGKSITELGESDRERLAALLERTGTEAYCFSSILGHQDVSTVHEKAFRNHLERGVASLLETSRKIPPKMIRLLGCWFQERNTFENSNHWLEKHARWIYAAYRDAVDALAEAGIPVTIENEPHCVLSNPEETMEFFSHLNRPGKVSFTWDIQNMWQSECYPTLEVYRALKSITNYVHLKGGIASADTPTVMTHRSLLADASWPVREIVEAVLEDGTSPVLCLNCSHGSPGENYPLKHLWGTPEFVAEEARRDAAWLRETFEDIE